PFAATPTTSIAESEDSASETSRRTTTESSTTRTRMGATEPPALVARSSDAITPIGRRRRVVRRWDAPRDPLPDVVSVGERADPVAQLGGHLGQLGDRSLHLGHHLAGGPGRGGDPGDVDRDLPGAGGGL